MKWIFRLNWNHCSTFLFLSGLTNIHSTLSCRFFLGNPLQHLTELSDKAFTVRNFTSRCVPTPTTPLRRPASNGAFISTGITRSNFRRPDRVTAWRHANSHRAYAAAAHLWLLCVSDKPIGSRSTWSPLSRSRPSHIHTTKHNMTQRGTKPNPLHRPRIGLQLEAHHHARGVAAVPTTCICCRASASYPS